MMEPIFLRELQVEELPISELQPGLVGILILKEGVKSVHGKAVTLNPFNFQGYGTDLTSGNTVVLVEGLLGPQGVLLNTTHGMVLVNGEDSDKILGLRGD